MKESKEKGLALIALILIVVVIALALGLGIYAISKNKTQNNLKEERNTSSDENKPTDKNKSTKKEEEKIVLENQTMYAEGNDSWKEFMEPQDFECLLYTDENDNKLISVKPIFKKCYNSINNSDNDQSGGNPNKAWTYYSSYEDYKGGKENPNYNVIYTWVNVQRNHFESFDKELASYASRNETADDYIEGSKVHSDIKEKTINGIKVKYVHIQAKEESYEKGEIEEIYNNKYECYVEFIEPYTKESGVVNIRIDQDTYNTDFFVDESIIDEVVSRLVFRNIKLVK